MNTREVIFATTASFAALGGGVLAIEALSSTAVDAARVAAFNDNILNINSNSVVYAGGTDQNGGCADSTNPKSEILLMGGTGHNGMPGHGDSHDGKDREDSKGGKNGDDKGNCGSHPTSTDEQEASSTSGPKHGSTTTGPKQEPSSTGPKQEPSTSGPTNNTEFTVSAIATDNVAVDQKTGSAVATSTTAGPSTTGQAVVVQGSLPKTGSGETGLEVGVAIAVVLLGAGAVTAVRRAGS